MARGGFGVARGGFGLGVAWGRGPVVVGPPGSAFGRGDEVFGRGEGFGRGFELGAQQQPEPSFAPDPSSWREVCPEVETENEQPRLMAQVNNSEDMSSRRGITLKDAGASRLVRLGAQKGWVLGGASARREGIPPLPGGASAGQLRA